MRGTVNAFAGLVSAGLAAAVLIGGCTVAVPGLPTIAPGEPGTAKPTNAQQTWADAVCYIGNMVDIMQSQHESINGLANLGTVNSRLLFEEQLDFSVDNAPTQMSQLVEEVTEVQPVGEAASDKAVSDMQQKSREVESTVQRQFEPASSSVSGDTSQQAAQLDTLLGTLPVFERTLYPVAKRNPDLAEAIGNSDTCKLSSVSSRQLPKASDGSDFSACQDGACEIEIFREAQVQLGEATLLLGISQERLHFVLAFDEENYVAIAKPGGTLFTSTSGGTLRVEVPAVTEAKAVAKFTLVPN